MGKMKLLTNIQEVTAALSPCQELCIIQKINIYLNPMVRQTRNNLNLKNFKCLVKMILTSLPVVVRSWIARKVKNAGSKRTELVSMSSVCLLLRGRYLWRMCFYQRLKVLKRIDCREHDRERSCFSSTTKVPIQYERLCSREKKKKT